jgi:hypothetical protein
VDQIRYELCTLITAVLACSLYRILMLTGSNYGTLLVLIFITT